MLSGDSPSGSAFSDTDLQPRAQERGRQPQRRVCDQRELPGCDRPLVQRHRIRCLCVSLFPFLVLEPSRVFTIQSQFTPSVCAESCVRDCCTYVALQTPRSPPALRPSKPKVGSSPLSDDSPRLHCNQTAQAHRPGAATPPTRSTRRRVSTGRAVVIPTTAGRCR